jgi:hypothetical protein
VLDLVVDGGGSRVLELLREVCVVGPVDGVEMALGRVALVVGAGRLDVGGAGVDEAAAGCSPPRVAANPATTPKPSTTRTTIGTSSRQAPGPGRATRRRRSPPGSIPAPELPTSTIDMLADFSLIVQFFRVRAVQARLRELK